MEEVQRSIEEVRERLQQLYDQFMEVEAELKTLESNEFRVCIFGSARIRPQDRTYKEVYRLARDLAAHGMDIVTGGGPGLMEAANRGVRDARNGRSKSYGLTILLPRSDEVPNRHLDIKSEHKRFSFRLDEFMRLSQAVVVAPGGIGTLLELVYVWQLLQVGLLERRPVILLGRSFWEGLIAWMTDQQLGKGFVSAHDFDSIRIVETTQEAVALLVEEAKRFEAALTTAPAPSSESVQEALTQARRTAEDAIHKLEQAQTLQVASAGKNGRGAH